MRIAPNIPLIVNADMSSSFSTLPFEVQQGWIGAIQAVWTGGGNPVGTLNLAVSNDNVTYSTYTRSITTLVGDGDILWNIASFGYNWVIVVYTPTSGTDVMNITANFKGNV